MLFDLLPAEGFRQSSGCCDVGDVVLLGEVSPDPPTERLEGGVRRRRQASQVGAVDVPTTTTSVMNCKGLKETRAEVFVPSEGENEA